MKTYQCHKVVKAAKILNILESMQSLIPPGKGGATLFLDTNYTLQVSPEFLAKHNPEIGGYLVRYEDGYQSYSPAKAFEEGYAPVETTLKETTFVERMLTEYGELYDRLSKLIVFLGSEKAKELPDEERGDLHFQRAAMALYLDTLTRRIARQQANG